jgi:hypothetical protein
MDHLDQVPPWILRPLPANAAVDEELHARIDRLAEGLPGSIWEMRLPLEAVRNYPKTAITP